MDKKNNGKYDHIIDGSILLGIGVVFLLILLGVFGYSGKIVANTLVGIFGYCVYAYVVAMILIGVLRLFKVSPPKTKVIKIISCFFVVGMVIGLLHTISSSSLVEGGYGNYLLSCYNNHNTAGGIIGGVFVYPLLALNYYFAIVFFAIMILLFSGVIVFYDAWLKDILFGKERKKGAKFFKFDNSAEVEPNEEVGLELNVYDANKDKKKDKKHEEFTYESLDSVEEQNKTKVEFDDGFTPLATKATNEEKIQKEKANIFKNLFEKEIGGKKEEKSVSSEEDKFNQAYDILYNNKEVKNNTRQSKITDEEKEQLYKYTNNYRMEKMRHNMSNNDNVLVSKDILEDTSIFNGFSTIEKKESENNEENIEKNNKPDYFDVSEIVVEKAEVSQNNNVEKKEIIKDNYFDNTYKKDIVKDNKSVLDDFNKNVSKNNAQSVNGGYSNARENNKNSYNTPFNSLNNYNQEVKNQSDIKNVSKDNSPYKSEEKSSGINSSIFDKEIQKSKENISQNIASNYEKKENIYNSEKVEDKTANHNEINDFSELLRQKKLEREKREMEEKLSSHLVEDFNPSVEEVKRRQERSDKGGTHQMGTGVKFNLQESNIPKLDAFNGKVKEELSEEEKLEQRLESKPQRTAPYKYPPIELLRDYDSSPDKEDFTEKIEKLENTLLSFNIDAKVINVVQGPTFTRLELQMPKGVSVNKIANYVNDIAMCLEVISVRCQIPIPGKNAFGVEIPNKVRGTVGLKSIITSEAFKNNKHKLSFVVGQDCDGNNYVSDLTKMPHLLIAGATGAGKSVCLNSLICSLLYKYSPDDLRLLLVDPKQVELNMYNKIPHLLIPNAVCDKDRALNLLDWAIDEMELRYRMFSTKRVQNIADYNDYAIANNHEKLPYIVIIIDEVGDFMVSIKKELEERIVRLTQKARAAGIVLILATQRPSVDVITGTIKANLPSRIAFAVASMTDSKTILDYSGAEKLLRNGDMLFMEATAPEPVRIQGTFISGGEVNSICDYIRDNNEAIFDADIEEAIMKNKSAGGNADDAPLTLDGVELDEKFFEALYFVVETGAVSITKLQRRFGFGFPRAARIVDSMEELGFIGNGKDGKQKEVLIDMQTLREKYGDMKIG